MSAVIGIDPSLSATGVANQYAELATIHTGPTDQRRLFHLIGGLIGCVGNRPEDWDLVVLEDLPANAKSAGLTGMSQGAIRYWLQAIQAPYVTVSAASLKKFATGKGNATKPDMRMALYQRTGIDCRDDNQVDAWWLRQIGLHLVGSPEVIVLPKTHLVALDKINKPEGIPA